MFGDIYQAKDVMSDNQNLVVKITSNLDMGKKEYTIL